MSSEKSMMVVTSRRDGAPTFRMLPISNECPFIEACYIPQAKALVIFHKHQVQGLHMVPQLDSNGDPIRSLKPRANGVEFKEERKNLVTAHESYITEKFEIKYFVDYFACNDFNYDKFMVEPTIITPEQPKIILNS
jgi:hypothetical protein